MKHSMGENAGRQFVGLKQEKSCCWDRIWYKKQQTRLGVSGKFKESPRPPEELCRSAEEAFGI
jgi:hypothetical protein